jgi:ComF family protein
LGVLIRHLRLAFDRLLPPRCLACGEAGDGLRPLCAICAEALPWNRCACPRCALPLPQAAPACGRCLRRPPPFAAACAPLRYADPVDRWLGALKFRNGLSAGLLLAELLDAEIGNAMAATRFDAVLPVPLHRRRLRERGFNQALELLRPLAATRGWTVEPGLLRRERDTPHQIGLDALTRRRNLKGAFRADPVVAGARLLLFDDVITTGSTLREAAGELLQAGAAEVQVLAVARAAR